MGQKIILILLILAAGTLIYKCTVERHTTEYPNPEEYPLDSAEYLLSKALFEDCYMETRDLGYDTGTVEDFCFCVNDETVHEYIEKFGRETFLQWHDEYGKIKFGTYAKRDLEAAMMRTYVPAIRKCEDRL